MFLIWSDILGWIGMVLVLAAYFMVAFKKISAQSYVYHFLNLIGVVFLAVNVFAQKAWPVFVLDIVWGLVAIVAVANIKKGKLTEAN